MKEIMNFMSDGKSSAGEKKFRCVGILVTKDGRCESEIKSRMGMAKKVFIKRKEELQTKNIASKSI